MTHAALKREAKRKAQNYAEKKARSLKAALQREENLKEVPVDDLQHIFDTQKLWKRAIKQAKKNFEQNFYLFIHLFVCA